MAPNRRQQWLEQQMHVFRAKALRLIKEILELSMVPAVPQELVEEALHSIFFLGKFIPVSPNEILAGELQQRYPEPFALYSSHVPQRHPMSCVLDMIVRVKGEGNENNIRQELQRINNVLNNGYDHTERLLISPTMCVSQNTETPNSVRYYGVSISASVGRSRDIMIAASCYKYWDPRVAQAVMTYYPDNVRRDDFDGTIKLPNKVRCKAFSITDGRKPPCESCQNLFGLRTTKQEYPYGNCAEVESLSNLFKNERFQAPTTLDILGNLLREAQFPWNNNNFYPVR